VANGKDDIINKLKSMPPQLWHSHICTHMTLTFDLWPWEPFQQYPLTW